MHGVFSHLLARVHGVERWEDLAHDLIFTPLEMNSTTFVPDARDRWDEFATGYARDGEELRVIPLEYAAYAILSYHSEY